MVSSSVPRLTVNAAIIIPKAVVSAVLGTSFDGVTNTSLVLLSDGEGSSVAARDTHRKLKSRYFMFQVKGIPLAL